MIKKFWLWLAPDGRNPWLLSWMKITPQWSKSVFDLRLGYKKSGRWIIISLRLWQPVQQNFWNGMFTCQLYLVGTRVWGVPVILPRVGAMCRYSYNRWWESGIGWLFDRGDFAVKFVFMEWNNEEKFNPNVNARGWEEGSV